MPLTLGISIWGGRGFDPSSLFAAGEQGVWYDPSDLSTLFQDAAGTIPVTAAGQPVGLMRDKSGRGNHVTQTTATSRPILQVEAGKWYLSTDGVDDWLSTPVNLPISASNKITVCVGIKKESDASVGALFETSISSSANTGTIAMLIPQAIATANLSFRSGGSLVRTLISPPIYPAPFLTVLTGQSDISSDNCTLRVNKVLSVSDSGDQGTGNYINYPLFLFRREGKSLPFNGRFYGLIISGAKFTEEIILKTEEWMNSKTGAY